MASRSVNLQQLITLTCDTIADVLDIYREQHVNAVRTIHPLILGDVKQLLAALQVYERQIIRINKACPGATIWPERSTQVLLNDCDILGQRLQLRLRGSGLRDNDETRQEICLMTESITQIVSRGGDGDSSSESPPPAPTPPATPQNPSSPIRRRNTVAPLAQSSGSSLVEVQELRSMLDMLIKENEDLKSQISLLDLNDQSKLHHIKRLHAAVKGLGMRHPMRHRLNSWEELTEELPHLIDHLDSTNDLLKDLEQGTHPGPTSSSQTARGKSQIRSEPTSPLRGPSMNLDEVVLRPPSPTDSNVSSVRELHPPPKKGHRTDKRKSTGGERRGFWIS